MKYIIFILLNLLFSLQVFSQIFIEQEISPVISTCGSLAQSQICIYNDSPYPIKNAIISLSYDEGLGMYKLISDKNIMLNSKPSELEENLTLLNLEPCSNICFTIFLEYDCLAFTGQRNIEINLHHDQNVIQTKASIIAYSPELELSTMEISYDPVTNSFSRIFQLTNIGNIKLKDFVLKNKDRELVTILTSSKARISTGGQELIFASKDFLTEGNKDGNFDPGEFLNIHQEIRIDKCFDNKPLTFQFVLDCNNKTCSYDVVSFQKNNLNISRARLGFRSKLLLPQSNCDTIVTEVKVFSRVKKSNNSVTNAYNVSLDIGWLSNNDRGIYYYDARIDFKEVIFNNQKYPLALNGKLFPFSCDVFNSDPDGPKGLQDLDQDGEFDDLLAGDTIHFILTAKVNPGSFEPNCRYNLFFPNHTLGINFTSQDFCKNVYIDSSDWISNAAGAGPTFNLKKEYLKAGVSLANHYFKDGRDTLNLSFPYPFSHFPLCNNPKVRFTISLPSEIELDQSATIVSNKPTQLISINNNGFILEAFLGDIIKIVVNNTCNPNLVPTSIIKDSTECYYCIENSYPKLVITYSTEFKCGEFCDEWVPLECITKKSIDVNCTNTSFALKKERSVLKVDKFELERVSVGFKDSTRTTYVNPNVDSLKLNSISQLDTFHIVLKISSTCTKMKVDRFGFIINTDYYYNYTLKQTFFPLEFYEYQTFFYKNGTIFYKDVQPMFTAITRGVGINIYNEYKFDSSRIMNNLIFNNSSISQYDSVMLVVIGRISKDVPHDLDGNRYSISGRLFTTEGNCNIDQNFNRSFDFSNRNISSTHIYLNWNSFYYYSKSPGETISLNCDSVELINSFNYKHFILSYNDFPNEFRLPYLLKTLENIFPEYWKAYSIGKLIKYEAPTGKTTNRFINNIQNNNTIAYTNVNLVDPWKSASFNLTTYLKPSCYVNILDSIQTVATVVQYIDKAEQETVRLNKSTVYKLPGLILKSYFNRVLFIKDSISDWFFTIQTPENPHSSNKNLSDLEHYYKFHNTWLYYEAPNSLNHPVSLEILLHGGTRKIIFSVPMVNPNAWIFKLDSVQKIVQCKLNVANKNCSLDSVKIILGNSCDGYPSDLKELPKTCIDYAPQFSLILDPRPAVIECKPIHPRKDIYVSKCDTIHESLRINNLGLGYASQTVLHVKVPLGVKLLNSTAIYTLSNPSQYNIPISFNPVLMEYDVVLTSNVLSSLFPGFTESDSSSIELKLIFAIDCDLDNGTSINYRISYEEVCSKAHSLPVKYTPRIFFKESIPSNNYTLDYKIEKSNSCTKDFILNVSLLRLNSNFNRGDRITITYDKIMGFNSQTPINSIGLKNNNYKYLVDNATESLTFELIDGLKMGDSVIIKIPMNSHCASNCKSTFLDLKIEELKTINCSTSPSGRCDHYSVTKTIYFDDVKLYPDIQIDSIDINYIGLDSSLIEFSSKIAITNSSKMDLYQDLKLKIFHDKNNNGQIDQGDILLERISNAFFIVKDSTYILEATHRVDPSLACPLLVVLFKEDNPCLCYSDTFIIQSHMIESLSQKFDLCESEELILDFRKQLAKGITISFDPNPYLTKLAENHFIFKKQITSGTSKEFEELLYEIEIASLCQSRNKIEIIIDPNCVKEIIDPKIYFPSVFSPNGDGINDDLILVGTDQIDKILGIKIYNRWGVLVHSNNHLPVQDNYPLWNGEMNGKPLNPGVFTYIIQILAKDGRKLNLTGDITLIR